MYDRIRTLRRDRHLTQTQVAEYLHCSQRAYSSYERGEIIMAPQILIRLARFYGTSVDYLLGLTDVKKPYPSRRKKKYL